MRAGPLSVTSPTFAAAVTRNSADSAGTRAPLRPSTGIISNPTTPAAVPAAAHCPDSDRLIPPSCSTVGSHAPRPWFSRNVPTDSSSTVRTFAMPRSLPRTCRPGMRAAVASSGRSPAECASRASSHHAAITPMSRPP